MMAAQLAAIRKLEPPVSAGDHATRPARMDRGSLPAPPIDRIVNPTVAEVELHRLAFETQRNRCHQHSGDLCITYRITLPLVIIVFIFL
jgi:hypothetical protein